MAIENGVLTGLDRLMRLVEVAEGDKGTELNAPNFYAALTGSEEGYKGLAALDLANALDVARQQAVDENSRVCEAAGASLSEARELVSLCDLLSKVRETAQAHMEDDYACVSAVGGDRGVEPAGKALALALAPAVRAAASERDAIVARAVDLAEGRMAGGAEAAEKVDDLDEPGDEPTAALPQLAERDDVTDDFASEYLKHLRASAPGAQAAAAYAWHAKPGDDGDAWAGEVDRGPLGGGEPARDKSEDMASILADVLSHAEAAIGLDVELSAEQYADVYGIECDPTEIRRHLGSRIAAYCRIGKF